MPSELHEQQNIIAAGWAKRQGFPVVATNISAIGCREKVDVIAFRSSCSLLIESKVSIKDFKADFKKPERQSGGVGLYRFYICPIDLIQPHQLPENWGLLYADGKKVIEVVRPRGNLWSSEQDSDRDTDWPKFQHDYDKESERNMLFSISRRLAMGKSILT